MTQAVSNKSNGNSFPSLMENFFSDRFYNLASFFNEFGIDQPFRIPEVNIVENVKDYQIELAAPGMDRKNFKIEVQNGVLSISAEKEQEKDEDGKNFRRREFSYNAFSRSFVLPENLLDEKIDAKYENGILKLTLPKKEAKVEKPVKQIKVA